MSISDAASTLLAHQNVSPAAPASAASNEPTSLVLVTNPMEQFESAPVRLPPISLFYNPSGYLVTQTLPTSAHLRNIVYVEWYHMGTIAQITELSQYEGITLRMPIDSILECDNILLLLAVIPVPGCSPLVTQFLIHQEMTFHLRIVVLLKKKNGQLWFLSKPSMLETALDSESLPISLGPTANYCFRIAFLREDLVSDAWILRHLQLTSLSAPVWIQIDAIIGQAGFVHVGPEDLYENTSQQADALQYWLPASLLENTTHFQWLMTLSVQVSQCPAWAFSNCNHTIQYLVTEILS